MPIPCLQAFSGMSPPTRKYTLPKKWHAWFPSVLFVSVSVLFVTYQSFACLRERITTRQEELLRTKKGKSVFAALHKLHQKFASVTVKPQSPIATYLYINYQDQFALLLQHLICASWTNFTWIAVVCQYIFLFSSLFFMNKVSAKFTLCLIIYRGLLYYEGLCTMVFP